MNFRVEIRDKHTNELLDLTTFVVADDSDSVDQDIIDNVREFVTAFDQSPIEADDYVDYSVTLFKESDDEGTL